MLSKIFKWSGIVLGSVALPVVTLVGILSAMGKTRLVRNDDPEPKFHASSAIRPHRRKANLDIATKVTEIT